MQELWQVLRATRYHIRGRFLLFAWPLLAASLTSGPPAFPRDMQAIRYILNPAYQAYREWLLLNQLKLLSLCGLKFKLLCEAHKPFMNVHLALSSIPSVIDLLNTILPEHG